jgi:hypothetical protein
LGPQHSECGQEGAGFWQAVASLETKGNTMRNSSRNAQRSFAVEDYFERKSRELIVPDDEIEAWELDAQDLNGLGTADYFNAPGSE